MRLCSSNLFPKDRVSCFKSFPQGSGYKSFKSFLQGSGYKSFSMDFQHIRNTEVKQPIFGANYLKGYVIAEPDGGWEGNANFNVNFPKGGAIDFAEIFQKTVKTSLRNRQAGVTPVPPMQPNGFIPQPGYPMPPPGQPGYPPQPGYAPGYAPGYPPPGAPGGYYPPPQESLYVYQAGGGPPPQGSNSGQAPPPYNAQASGMQQSSSGKEHEAYMSGSTAFVPNEAPPPYNPGYDPDRKDK